jgi:hypothetical protein
MAVVDIVLHANILVRRVDGESAVRRRRRLLTVGSGRRVVAGGRYHCRGRADYRGGLAN